jgi:hypothetical protein
MTYLKFFSSNLIPIFFLQKKRVLFLKHVYVKKKKHFYFLISRRKSLKLISKKFHLDYYSITESYKNNHRFFKHLYHFTVTTGLKIKNELKLKFSYFNIADFERINLINYNLAKIYNKNLKNIWFFSNYLGIKNINYNNKNMNKFIINDNFICKNLIGVVPNYYNWYYIYNVYVPNIKFKYLCSYNYLTKIRLKKFSWYLYNKKRLKLKNKLLILKLKNKDKILFFYEYLFYINLFNKNNKINDKFLNNFNFIFNTFEYYILTNYLNVEEDSIIFYNKNFPYYFKNVYSNLLNNNIFNNLLNNNKIIKYNNIYIQSLFLFSFVNNKYIKINKINKINKKIRKNNFNFIFIYYYILLINFIYIFSIYKYIWFI